MSLAEDRRFIEETFPIREISEESVREKSIRHGHISTLHIWWARRPLASSRATNFTALIPAPKSEMDARKLRDFVIRLSKWENSLDSALIEEARRLILSANGGRPPKVLDPFAGGGSIPLEALRLGCETYASDYNPVATLILKCALEYPQKYGSRTTDPRYVVSSNSNKLLKDVERWGNWVLEEARKEIGRFYPDDEDGSTLVGYIWARTIPCQNPSCNAEIPLMRQYWLAKKENRRISLYPYVEGKQVRFEVVGTGYEPMPSNFNPEKGSVSKAIVTCQVCGSTISGNTTRKLFSSGKSGQRMIAVVLHKEGKSGKKYRVANEDDFSTYQEAEKYLEKKRAKLVDEWGIDPIPDEPIKRVPVSFGVINVWVYGMLKWGDLFNSRQKLALITFAEKVRQAHEKMLAEGYDEEYAKAVVSYLGLVISRISDFETNLCRWHPQWEFIPNMFARQAVPMAWDYSELNPLSPILSGTFESMFRQVLKPLDHISQIAIAKAGSSPTTITQASATELPFPGDYFDAIITDPPYYDNVPYSYLSDFFYVWLKRAVGHLYPELFATPLTPKSEEIVAYSNIPGGFEAGKKFFEDRLKRSFTEINRALKPNGVALIVYAHKSTAGWETLINSLLDSSLVVTATWPIHTEMRERLRAIESAALASSIYIVARKLEKQRAGFYSEVRQELREYLRRKLDQIWNEGISGADFFVSAIGSSIEVFGRYEKVIDDEGNVVRADRLLEDMRKIVTDYAIRQVLHNGFVAEIKPMTRLYVLWRWAYGNATLEFDEARKLGQGVGVDIAQEWNKGFIRKDKEFIELLGPEDRKIEELQGSSELIDVLHHALLLWKGGKSEELIRLLSESGYGKRDVFYRVAQAISESLPNDSKEKKLLEGFLAGRDRIRKDLKEKGGQRRLFEE